jgi:hypothetical protein
VIEEGAELWNPVSDRLTIPMERSYMEAIIDRKYTFKAVSNKSGKVYTEKNALVFLLKDALLPDLLDKYYELCSNKGADERQLVGLKLLKDRVLKWQRKNESKVRIPDVEPGKEEKRICKPNK